jgi:hypothetical protein
MLDFGDPIGLHDSWWSGMRPPLGDWVVFEAHLWRPPGTHSDEPVLWVDRWVSTLPRAEKRRALRHQRRMQKRRLVP